MPHAESFILLGELIARKDAQIQELVEQLTRARTDSVTRLETRQVFDDHLAAEADSNPGNFALLFFDLDGLKEVNDTQDHLAGDDLLRRAGQGVHENLRTNPEDKSRPSDEVSVYRYGGDEIVAIVRNVSDQALATAIMERVQTTLAEQGINMSGGCRIHNTEESVAELVRKADEAMHDQKIERKMRSHTSEQHAIIKAAGDLLTAHGVTFRDAATLYPYFKDSDEASE